MHAVQPPQPVQPLQPVGRILYAATCTIATTSTTRIIGCKLTLLHIHLFRDPYKGK